MNLQRRIIHELTPHHRITLKTLATLLQEPHHTLTPTLNTMLTQGTIQQDKKGRYHL